MNETTDSAAALQLRRLRWRARRGLLENDLILARFFERYADRLNDTDINALNRLLALADNDLLELLLDRTPAPHALASPQPAITRVLALLRSNSSFF